MGIVTLEEIIRMLIARYGRADPQGISMTSPLAAVGLNEIGVAEMVIYLEARFGISIRTSEASGWTTGHEIIVTMKRLLAEDHLEAG